MYRIGICDDDKILCSALEEQIYELSKELAIKIEIDVWYSGESIENDLKKGIELDLLFLDIEMPDMSGLDFLESAQNAPKVIITSAYERYALRGYEFDVVDYLLKPISFSRFLKSVNKAHALMESTSKSEEPAYIFVKTEKQLKRLYLKEIQFIEGMENYIVIHTLTSKEIVHLRLKSIQETLPAQIFMQVHRSFIVNLSYVQAIEGNLLIIGEHKIPVSRPLREEVYKSIVNNQLIQR